MGSYAIHLTLDPGQFTAALRRKEHQADRIAIFVGRRPENSADRQSDIGFGMRKCASRHLDDHIVVHGAEPCHYVGINVEGHRLLFLAIGHVGALQNLTGTFYMGQHGRDQTRGARFRGHGSALARLQGLNHLFRTCDQFLINAVCAQLTCRSSPGPVPSTGAS